MLASFFCVDRRGTRVSSGTMNNLLVGVMSDCCDLACLAITDIPSHPGTMSLLCLATIEAGLLVVVFVGTSGCNGTTTYPKASSVS